MLGSVKRVLALSVTLNILALGGVGYAVYRKGGRAYIRDSFHKPAGLNSALTPDDISYLTRETFFERLPTRAAPIVFLGDSQTANCEWSELFPGAVNRGIGGDTSATLLKRISDTSRLHPQGVFLLIGANDFARGTSPQETAFNIQSAVYALRSSSPDTTIFIEGLLPTWFARRNAFARDVNRLLQPVANGTTIFYLDFYKFFLDGDLLSSKLSFDGLHLNGEGFILWGELLRPHVTPLLQASNLRQ